MFVSGTVLSVKGSNLVYILMSASICLLEGSNESKPLRLGYMLKKVIHETSQKIRMFSSLDVILSNDLRLDDHTVQHMVFLTL